MDPSESSLLAKVLSYSMALSTPGVMWGIPDKRPSPNLPCKRNVKNISVDPLENSREGIVGFRPGTVVGPFGPWFAKSSFEKKVPPQQRDEAFIPAAIHS